MSNILYGMSDGKLPFSLSDSLPGKVAPPSTPNVDMDASDGPHTGILQASRDPAKDHYDYHCSQKTSVSTTGKESESKATQTETTKPEKPSIRRGILTGWLSSSRASHDSVTGDWWLAELGACLVSAMAMTALIIVIGHHNGKPLPKWPLHMTIATFIAICSTITKATLLVPVVESVSQYKWYHYHEKKPSGQPREKQDLDTMVLVDNASRGIPGSIKLLFSERKGVFASLGALLIILAIPIEACFQEAVYTPQRWVKDTNQTVSIITRIQRYTHPWPIQLDLLDEPKFRGVYTAEKPVKAAVYEGLFGDTRGMTASCSTGNCTWPKFASLSVCSRCQNVTTSIDSLHTLPNGLSLAEKASVNATTSIKLSEIGYTPWAILNMSVLGHDAAYECSVFWCVKEYDTVMIDGILYENEVTTWSNGTLEYDRDESTNSLTPACSYEQGLDRNGLQGLALQSGSCHGGVGCCYINLYANGSDAENMTFSVDFMTHYTLGSFLEDSLQGNITLPYQTSPVYTPDAMQALVTLHGPVPKYSNFTAAEDIVSNLTLVDVPELLDNITKSVSVRFRQAVDPEDKANRVVGSAYRNLPVIDFRRKWLIYPGFLLISAFSFLVATIKMNSDDDINIWKSDPAAMLFVGLADEHRQKAKGQYHLSQLARQVGGTEVLLKEDTANVLRLA